MICYRDMTFCPFWTDCILSDVCNRSLTQDVEAAAKRARLEIAQYVDKPSCWIQDPPTFTQEPT